MYFCIMRYKIQLFWDVRCYDPFVENLLILDAPLRCACFLVRGGVWRPHELLHAMVNQCHDRARILQIAKSPRRWGITLHWTSESATWPAELYFRKGNRQLHDVTTKTDDTLGYQHELRGRPKTGIRGTRAT